MSLWIVGPSVLHGRGVIATQDIPRGTDLGVAFLRVGPTSINRWVQTPLGAMHNHSEQPNTAHVLQNRTRSLVASRDIARGEEITTDYRLQRDWEQPLPSWK